MSDHSEEFMRQGKEMLARLRDELEEKTKVWRISRPRAFAWAVMHATGRFSYPQLARMFGGFDHSTVIRAIKEQHEWWGEALFQELADAYNARFPIKYDNFVIPGEAEARTAAQFIAFAAKHTAPERAEGAV